MVISIAHVFRPMLIVFSVKNKLDFVNGSMSRLSDTDPNMSNSWIINNNIVISWLVNYVIKEVPSSILFETLLLKDILKSVFNKIVN